MRTLLEVILLILLLLFAAVSAASEIALIAMSRLRLRKLAHDGSKTAKIILKILEAPEKLFGTILVANNIVDTLIAVIVSAMIIRLLGSGEHAIFLATVIASFLIIVAEVCAKTIAAWYPEYASNILAIPVKMMITVFMPVVRILSVVTQAVEKMLGGKRTKQTSLVTEEEIRAIIKIGNEDGVLQKDKYLMLGKVFDFNETIVRSVMTPRTKIVAIDIKADLDTILIEALESGYSRIPVYKESKDNIVGVVNMKDLLNLSVNKGLIVLQDIIYPPFFVAGTKKITEILKEFQKGHTHLAFVVDAKGKIEGLVTLEDLLEELVGEIEDEYDVKAK